MSIILYTAPTPNGWMKRVGEREGVQRGRDIPVPRDRKAEEEAAAKTGPTILA